MENPIKMDDLGVPLFSETPNLCFLFMSRLFFRNFAKKLRFPWHSCSTSFWLVIGRVLMPRRLDVQEVRISMGINDQRVSYFTYL